ncbi:Uma2 family endonuclease [Aurantimonas sp. VKM B-3413]|uniref:Uma2 family endonuclease n=1 Tax=Aurantimonas sp. VKM B-3413 TaxID=2779401 RepID=UPI001E5EAFF6|nr:Uma2 family endonuclease [Aurantimonas sp. VKM B-3413]MCB8839843.1 Uma2 family endonuclease [Aurantimonas sp. VKM B-3413]
MSAFAETILPADLPTDLTVEAFFDWLERQERHFELVEGTPLMLPNVRRSHARIVSNIDRMLQRALDPDRYLVTQGDFAIRTGPRSIRYADIFVDEASDDLAARTTDRAILIVEVLSDSTAPNDFGPKRLEYQTLPNLQTYLIVDQDKPCLWAWLRRNGTWEETPAILTTGTIAVESLQISLPLPEIYRNIFKLS